MYSHLKYEDLMNRFPTEVIENLKKTEQDEKYHREGCVWNHIRLVFIETLKTNNIDLIISAIFHDLGKIDTTEKKTDSNGNIRISAIGHEKVSLKYVEKYSKLFDDFDIDWEKVKNVISEHMRCHYYISGQMSNKQKRNNFESNKYFNDIIQFSKCDDKGRL